MLVLLLFPWYSPADELKRITILQTADIHSRTGSASEPGIRQLAGALDSERQKAGGAGKCLLIDCGDLLQGSLAASSTKGGLGLAFMNELGYDAWIPGNHDFDFGTARFLEFLKGCRPSMLAANLYADGKRPALPWKIFEKDGMRIAVIGMTSPGLDRWHWGRISYGMTASPISGPLDAIIPEVTESRCDMIILAVHQGPFQSEKADLNLGRIAEKYPQIDLVLGAHTHQPVPGENAGFASWYVQPDPYCASFSLIKAEVDVKRHRTVKIESKLVGVAQGGSASFKFSSSLENLLSKANVDSRKAIVSVDKEIPADELNRMTADAYFSKLPDAACALLIPQERIINTGKFTEEDLYWTFPYEDTLCSIELSAEELKTVEDEAARLKDATKLQIVENRKSQLPAVKMKVALSSYLLAGAGGRMRTLADFARDPGRHTEDGGISIRDVFRKYIAGKFQVSR